MTLFDVGWLADYLSITRSGIAVGAALIVAICLHRRRQQRPVNWDLTALVFGLGTLSNIAAAYTTQNPSVLAGLAMCALNTAVMAAVWLFALRGLSGRWDGYDDP